MSNEKCTDTEHGKRRRLSYRLREFAALTGLPYSTVHDRCKDGRIPTVQIGEIKVIPATYVESVFNGA
jgi:hypothetical protein